MKSKAPLSLMEQIVMVLVFALCSVLCMEVFIFSGKLSKKEAVRDRAVIEAECIAENMKASGKTAEEAVKELRAKREGEVYVLYFDTQQKAFEAEPAEPERSDFRIVLQPVETESKYLNKVKIRAADGEDTLAELTAAWQKGAAE